MVSEIGLGAWQLSGTAWGATDKPEALRIVSAALEAGCDFFDTAPGYGRGRSEEILGEALAPVRERVTICTKFGHDADGTSNFAPAALGLGLEGSLRRLRTDYVDVLLLHNPGLALMDGQRGGATLFGELERLKTQGKVRVYGVSLDGKQELETVLQTTRSGAVEVLYNAFHQEPGEAFARAAAQGVGLIVKVPLDSGWLSGKYRRDSRFTDVRERWSPQVIARRAQLVEEFARWVPAGMTMGHSGTYRLAIHSTGTRWQEAIGAALGAGRPMLQLGVSIRRPAMTSKQDSDSAYEVTEQVGRPAASAESGSRVERRADSVAASSMRFCFFCGHARNGTPYCPACGRYQCETCGD